MVKKNSKLNNWKRNKKTFICIFICFSVCMILVALYFGFNRLKKEYRVNDLGWYRGDFEEAYDENGNLTYYDDGYNKETYTYKYDNNLVTSVSSQNSRMDILYDDTNKIKQINSYFYSKPLSISNYYYNSIGELSSITIKDSSTGKQTDVTFREFEMNGETYILQTKKYSDSLYSQWAYKKTNIINETNILNQKNIIPYGYLAGYLYDPYHRRMCYTTEFIGSTCDIAVNNNAISVDGTDNSITYRSYDKEGRILEEVKTNSTNIDLKRIMYKYEKISNNEFYGYILSNYGDDNEETQYAETKIKYHTIKGKLDKFEIVSDKEITKDMFLQKMDKYFKYRIDNMSDNGYDIYKKVKNFKKYNIGDTVTFSPNGTDTYYWNVIKESNYDEEYITIMMSKNIGSDVQWNSNDEPIIKEAFKQLKDLTSDWNYEARIITGDELLHALGENWSGKMSYKILLDNTFLASNTGCDVKTCNGIDYQDTSGNYWTSSLYDGLPSSYCSVDAHCAYAVVGNSNVSGIIAPYDITRNNYIGVRPVITIKKEDL